MPYRFWGLLDSCLAAKELRQLLEDNRKHATHPVLGVHWAACFCLFVAECFRREYNASSGSWAWASFENRVQCSFSPQQHADIVEKGLKYWIRPIRQGERGRDLLGSLFAEGGLPWLLVQSETHGFGRAVRQGLKNFYRTEGARRTTTDLMADFEQYLPQTFHTLETRQLLAGIVEQLMHLVEHYPLKDQADPADYLDKHNPDWRSTFPIPLDEDNARSLINEWLKDAGKRRQEIKAAEEKALAFTCRHQLLGGLPAWRISTELTLPQKETLKLDVKKLNSTRLELGFYEGERLLAKGGAIYGQITNDGLSVRFPNTKITLERRELREPINLRLLEYGHPVYVFHFEHSTLDYDDQPLIFESIAEQWWFAADASVLLTNTKARLRLPPNFTLITGKATELASEVDGSLWLDTTEALSFRNDRNDVIFHKLKSV
jgi:hypothetical protein